MDEIKSRKEEESNLVSTLRRVRYNIYVHQKSLIPTGPQLTPVF